MAFIDLTWQVFTAAQTIAPIPLCCLVAMRTTLTMERNFCTQEPVAGTCRVYSNNLFQNHHLFLKQFNYYITLIFFSLYCLYTDNKRTAKQSCDQTLIRTNLALARNCDAGVDESGAVAKNWQDGKPVRVVRSSKLAKHSSYAPQEGFR